MISDRGMAALRVAATLTHVLPGLGARIRHADRVVLDVEPVPVGPEVSGARSDHLGYDAGRRVIAPSAFRCAVGRAHERRRAGEPLRFLDLEPGCEPMVDIGVPHRGAGRPGGLFRVPFAGRWLWGMATTIPAPTAFALGADIVDAALPVAGVHALGIRPDPATDVSLVFAETFAGPGSRGEAEVLDLFESLLARWTAHELMQPVAEPRGLRTAGGGPGAAGLRWSGSA